MRLIDADKFDFIVWGIPEEKEYGDNFGGGVAFIVDKIYNAPTINPSDICEHGRSDLLSNVVMGYENPESR